MLVFRIAGQKIDLERREVVADEQVAFVNLLFLFTPEWEQIDKVAQFKQNEIDFFIDHWKLTPHEVIQIFFDKGE